MFSTTSAPRRPRMPVLWIARARTSGQEVGPKMASSRNAQMYSGMARTRNHYDEMFFLILLGGLLVLIGDLVSAAAREWVRRQN